MEVLTFIKKYWREISILVLFFACAFSMRTCRNKTGELRLALAKSDTLFTQGLELKLKDNTKLLKIRQLEGTTKQLREQGIIDEVEMAKLREQNVKLKGLVSYYSGQVNVKQDFGVVVHDTVLMKVESADTLRTKEKAFTFHNKWLDLVGLYNPAVDTARIKYGYTVDFSLTSYREKGKLYANINFNDPAVTTSNLKAIAVTEPPTPWYRTTVAKIAFGLVVGIAITR